MDKQYNGLEEAIQDGDSQAAAEESRALIEKGLEVTDIFINCVEPVLSDIGDKFSRLEVFLPELMLAADAVKAVQAELEPIMRANPASKKDEKRAVIATINGDVHDIGKNIVALMLEVNGFKVKNLGVDIATKDIISAAESYDADLICVSSLMMPSLPYMRDLIELVKGNPALSDRFKILVGGGPVTKAWADGAGADGYADDAVGAVAEAQRVTV